MYPNMKNVQRRKLLGLISMLDDSVGQIVAALTAKGILNNTIIAFTSDNGGSVGDGMSNYPLRGSKGTLYEGGHRVRAFLNDPKLGSHINSGIFHAVDWIPTLLDASIDANISSYNYKCF